MSEREAADQGETVHESASGSAPAALPMAERARDLLDGLKSSVPKPGTLLGEGGMGEVRLASDPAIGRQVAMKVIHKHAATPTAIARFLLEARVTGMLEHPSIVPVHQLGVDDVGDPYYTMMRVRGRALDDLLEAVRRDKATLPVAECVDIFLKVCDAIEFAHAQGVIHRDIKPANVMVGEFGEVLVMDWGLAKFIGVEGSGQTLVTIDALELGGLVDDELVYTLQRASDATGALTMDGTVLGSPSYMAPEQARGEIDQVDRLSDVYALGALLFDLLTLLPCVALPDPEEVIERVCRGEIDDPETAAWPGRPVPKPLANVVRKAMALEKGDRYPSVSALRADVEAYRDRRSGVGRSGLLAIIALFVLSALVAGYGHRQAGEATTRAQASEQRAREAGSRFAAIACEAAAVELAGLGDGYFRPVIYRLEMLKSLALDGGLEVSERSELNRQLRAVITTLPHVSSINLGSDAGSNHMLMQQDGGWLNRIVAPGEKPSLQQLDMRGKPRGDAKVVSWDYDPREKPWFKAGLAGSGAQWTAPYVFQTTRDPGISAAIGWQRDGRQWVAACDLLLTDVSALTRKLSLPEPGMAALLAGDKLVALPALARFKTTASVRASSLKTPKELGLGPLVDGLAAWSEAQRPTQPLQFQSAGRGWWITVRPVSLGTLKLRSVAVMPDLE